MVLRRGVGAGNGVGLCFGGSGYHRASLLAFCRTVKRMVDRWDYI